MNKVLHYISISHKTASVAQREVFHISEEEKSALIQSIQNSFPDIEGLLLLSTCNRTEIYFESELTSGKKMRNFFIHFKTNNNLKTYTILFKFSNNTEDTIRHLLQVSSGLESLVLGDVEIIHQIKKAYQFSMTHKLQGSLLERALQTVFKSHKRISNETNFRDGTTSVAYKSLKVIRDTYNRSVVKSKKILFIGAGDIVKQLFKYNAKFKFNNLYISNRSEEKAIALANRYSCKTYDWNKVLANNFEGFDVIISAVSNCPQLIKSMPDVIQKTLLIDLGIPSNINPELAKKENIICYDLDTISIELNDTKEKRIAAMTEVNAIINEEFINYQNWLQGSALRTLLADYKIIVNDKIKDYFENNKEEYNDKKIIALTNQVMRKLMAETETLKSISKVDALIAEQVSL